MKPFPFRASRKNRIARGWYLPCGEYSPDPEPPSRHPLIVEGRVGETLQKEKVKSSRKKGLRSADRNSKTTLPLTRPWRTIKSYAKDSTPRMVKLQSADGTPGYSARGPVPACWGTGPKPIRIRLRCAGEKSPRSGMGSDLEAFSHNPADGSFAALPGQTAAKTNYLNQRFLSY